MRSVSARLPLRFVLLGAGVWAIFCAGLYLWMRQREERLLEKELVGQAQMFHERFVEEIDEVRRGVHASLQDEMESFLRGSGARAEVRRPDGSLVFAPHSSPPDAAGFRVRADTVTDGLGESFVIRVGVSETPHQEALKELRLYLAVFAPIALCLQWLFGAILVRRAISPVEEIRDHAERISRSNVSERVPERFLTGEFKDLAHTFNEMLTRLESAIEDLQNFAADAAHELRTPLANLRAEMETAIQEERSPAEYERILASVSEEVARMNRIVTDLFTLAKIDMRQYALQKERVSLRPLLEEARETWQRAAAERGVEIRLEGQDADVMGDAVALRRVFMNLVENAVKYNRPGGKVNLSIGRKDSVARVRVQDTGIGIPQEHVPWLFRRFYRVDKARSRESGGAGLGLAICKSFVEAQAGRIEVESAPGTGSVFTVELPAIS